MNLPADFVRLAQSQDGIVTRRQALDHGVSADAIRYAVGPGARWQKIHAGVYATFNGPLQRRHILRAALLVAGPSAVVSGVPACQAYGMRYLPDGPDLILVPHNMIRLPMLGVEFRRTRALPLARDVRTFRCAPPERAVVDAVRHVRRLRDVRAALCEVVQRELTGVDQLVSVVSTLRCDNPHFLQALLDITAGCRSSPECECLELIGTSSVLPAPRLNEPLDDLDVVPDGRWDEAKLIYEIDSAEWHRYGDRPEHTERRRAKLAAAGWRVIPISPRRLREEPDVVLKELEVAYFAGLGDSAGVG